MPRPEPVESRGRLRVWLKMALQSGQLDRVPPVYDPDGRGGGVSPREYAAELLDALNASETGTRPPAEVVAAVQRFRAWVGARQQHARRLILAEEGGPVLHLPPERRSPPPPTPPAPRAGRREDRRPPTLLDHPLWDRWLDS